MSKQSWVPMVASAGALAVFVLCGGLVVAYQKWGSNATPAGSAPRPVAKAGAAASALAAHRGTCPEGMVFVEAGTLNMGSPDGQGKPEEHPVHPVKIEAFCIGGTEVTVGEYRACMDDARNEQKCTPPRNFASCNALTTPRARHPINCVDWQQAVNYCKWAGGALPTEAQWEYAARGSEGRKYPWGDQPPASNLLNACGRECSSKMAGPKPMYDKNDKYPETAPVGSFVDGASPFGALDMAGNVAEWVADPRAPYPGGEPFPKANEDDDVPPHTIRGGSYLTRDPEQVRAAARPGVFDTGSISVGFRCVHAP